MFEDKFSDVAHLSDGVAGMLAMLLASRCTEMHFKARAL